MTPFSTTPATLSVNFSTPATITAGTNYAFTIGFIVVGSGHNELGYEAGSAPAGKRLVTDQSGPMAVDPTDGINFTTYVEEADPPTDPPKDSRKDQQTETLAATGANDSAVNAMAPFGTILLVVAALTRVVRRRRVARN
jgi:hypothetical protein